MARRMGLVEESREAAAAVPEGAPLAWETTAIE